MEGERERGRERERERQRERQSKISCRKVHLRLIFKKMVKYTNNESVIIFLHYSTKRAYFKEEEK